MEQNKTTNKTRKHIQHLYTLIHTYAYLHTRCHCHQNMIDY